MPGGDSRSLLPKRFRKILPDATGLSRGGSRLLLTTALLGRKLSNVKLPPASGWHSQTFDTVSVAGGSLLETLPEVRLGEFAFTRGRFDNGVK